MSTAGPAFFQQVSPNNEGFANRLSPDHVIETIEKAYVAVSKQQALTCPQIWSICQMMLVCSASRRPMRLTVM